MESDFSLGDQKMERVVQSSGDFFPVADACNRSHDPQFGCLWVESSFLQSNISVPLHSKQLEIFILQNHTVVNQSVPLVAETFFDKHDLHCVSEVQCNETCSQKGGIWFHQLGFCNVTKYLASICYRVQLYSDGYYLDHSSLVAEDEGCFSSNAWSPFHYSFQPAQSPIPVFVLFFTLYHLRFAIVLTLLFLPLFLQVVALIYSCQTVRINNVLDLPMMISSTLPKHFSLQELYSFL